MDLAVPRRVEIETQGESLVHYIRELPTAQWLAWQRKIGQLNGDGDTLAQVALWYDEHVVKVEGYTFKGKELMQIDDWKSLIPGAHKLAAWTELVTGDNLKKKSLTTSNPSPSPSEPAQEN